MAHKTYPKSKTNSSEGEQTFSLLFESHPIPMFVYDLKTLAILDVNKAAEKKYGYSRHEFQALTLKDILPTQGVIKKQPEMHHSGEWRHQCKDGRVIDVDITSHTLEYDGRQASLVMAQDITERKQAGQDLRESEERYHSLFNSVLDGIYRSTHEGKFIDVNPAMVKMFGYSSKEEMLAVDIKNELYFAPEERGSHILDTGQEEMDVYRMRRKDSSEIWVEDHGYYVHDKQGNIMYHEGILRDISERRQAEEGLRRAKESLELANRELEHVLMREQKLARTDGLTGLCNYRYFFELASHEFSAAIRYQRPLAILMFDTDYLKQVNDTLGHLAGDDLLVLVAQTAIAQLRAVDVLARYGGDEFVVLLSQTSAQQAVPIAERIRTSVAAMRVQTNKGPLTVTLSIGIAEIWREPADESVERVVQRADKALYSAKQTGRNRTVVFHPGLS